MNERGPLLFGLGALSVLVGLGAKAWAEDLNLKMPWWKWGLAGSWYGAANLAVAAGFTLRGEKEKAASDKFLLSAGGLLGFSGVILAAILLEGKESPKRMK
jgi:hypothetical protein